MLRVVLATGIFLFAFQGCNRVVKQRMKSRVVMNDPDISKQLVSGFYGLEGNSWRWTARQFVVTFPGFREVDMRRQHSLRLSVFVPEGQIKQLGSLTLNADVNGTVLTSETFREPGVHTYMRSIPQGALESNIIPVVFFLDKATAPGPAEGRELGLVVNDAQLLAN